VKKILYMREQAGDSHFFDVAMAACIASGFLTLVRTLKIA